MRRVAISFVLAISGITAVPVAAAEAITYTYDARGRLVKVERSGTINNGVKSEYSHDRANNRQTVVVTGSS